MPLLFFSRQNTTISSAKIRACMKELLSQAGLEDATVELSLVGEKKMIALNQKYRQKKQLTDVLSFPLDAGPMAAGIPWCLGEIVIATPVAKRQALLAGRKLTDQIVRLALHGLLHLQGLDHEKGERAQRQFLSREKKYLKHLLSKRLIKWDGSLQF